MQGVRCDLALAPGRDHPEPEPPRVTDAVRLLVLVTRRIRASIDERENPPALEQPRDRAPRLVTRGAGRQ